VGNINSFVQGVIGSALIVVALALLRKEVYHFRHYKISLYVFTIFFGRAFYVLCYEVLKTGLDLVIGFWSQG